MSKRKMTPWFPAWVRPVRVGVYEIRTHAFNSPNYRHWDGKGWGGTWSTTSGAYEHQKRIYAHGDGLSGWRGLAKKP